MTRTHHALRPFVHDLDEPGLECAELLAGHAVPVLHPPDAVRNLVDRGEALLQLGRDDGLDVRLLLEDEAREERDDLFGVIRRERVLEDELRKDELVRGVDLLGGQGDWHRRENGGRWANFACYTALEQYGRVVVDELKLLQYLDPLFVIGDELEVLF